MKHFIRLLGLILLLPVTAMATEETNKPPPQQLATYNEDVTGDAEKETIDLKGLLFADDTEYYVDTWVSISSKDDEEWEVQYEGGYQPRIKFRDLNHDGVKDILYQRLANKNANLHDYQLHTLNNGKLNKMALPEQKYITAQFNDDFQVEVQLSPDKKPANVDISDQASKYAKLGIYDKNGKLLERTSPMIEPIASFKPIKISKEKGYGLKSKQRIHGAFRNHRLGTVETLWYYEQDQWIILKTEWVPSN
ncbi:hypothetical protein EU245_02745 [Lentibacillus lipolyticus]|nr:hypothetical protein EU245_02745 [Lentibacillus lipolyticus]